MRNDTDNPVVHWTLIAGGVKTLQFHGFLSQLEPDGDDVILILDSAVIHTATDVVTNEGCSTVAQLAEERGITLNYLPLPTCPLSTPWTTAATRSGNVLKLARLEMNRNHAQQALNGCTDCITWNRHSSKLSSTFAILLPGADSLNAVAVRSSVSGSGLITCILEGAQTIMDS